MGNVKNAGELEKSMQSTKINGMLTAELTYVALALANLPAMIFMVWLVPGVVGIEAAAWVILALTALRLLLGQSMLPQFVAGLRSSWILLPFLLFSGISIAWSVSLQASVSRWLVLAASLVVGGMIGLRYGGARLIKILSIFSAAVLAASLLVVVFAPGTGVMNYHIIQGAWKGIFWHKNHMGFIAAFAGMLFLVDTIGAAEAGSKRAWGWGLLYVFSLLFLSQTDSVGAYLTLAVIHGLILLAVAHMKLKDRLQRRHYVVLAGALLLIVAAIFANSNAILRAVGRNSTLTGRVPMWTYLFDTYFSQHPWLGYGFNAFWDIGAHRVAMAQAAGYPDPIVIADNGFIDILMNTGYIGLALFLLFYLGLWWRSLIHAWAARGVVDLFPLFLMAFTLLTNATWSLMFENESYMMLVMIAVMFWLSRSTAMQHQPDAQPKRPVSTATSPL